MHFILADLVLRIAGVVSFLGNTNLKKRYIITFLKTDNSPCLQKK